MYRAGFDWLALLLLIASLYDDHFLANDAQKALSRTEILAVMPRTLKASLFSFSLSRANRVGSDDKISRLASHDCLKSEGSYGDRTSECDQAEQDDDGYYRKNLKMMASVEQLRQELEVKERMISELRRKLETQSSSHSRSGSVARPPHRKTKSSLIARSASIISSKKW